MITTNCKYKKIIASTNHDKITYINRNSNIDPVFALVANKQGEIFDLKNYAAVGRTGTYLQPLSLKDTTKMPQDSELMFLPERRPILYNLKNCEFETLYDNPYNPGEIISPVAVFNSPGYLLSHTCSYQEIRKAKTLPLFSYGAVGLHKNKFFSAAILVDSEPRQNLKEMSPKKILAGVKYIRKLLPKNNVRRQLEKCALTYGCPASKNFFLGRYEAPLPTSKACNSKCLGCISLQSNSNIVSSQNRINFTPLAKDVADVALLHIKRVKHAIVSFGQGCEGDPLLASNTVISAIKIIRNKTNKGTIHINTNGSLPIELEKMFDAGLDSMRISINSFRKNCYNSYYKPTNYSLQDVLDGILLAISKKKYVSINYLSCPGFTDSREEFEAFEKFLTIYQINMIQWRNLNFDPAKYITLMNKVSQNTSPIGMEILLNKINYRFPTIKHGYFNPPKEKF